MRGATSSHERRKETLADASPPRPEGNELTTTGPFAFPRTGRYALSRGARARRSLPEPQDRSTLTASRSSTFCGPGRDRENRARRRRRLRRRAAAVAMSGTHRAAAVRRRPHPSRQGPHLAAEAQPDRRFPERARRRDRGPCRQLDRAPTSPRAWSSACAAPTRTGRRPFAPISTASARRRGSAGRSSPRRASAGAAGSSFRRRLFSASSLRWTTSHMAEIEAMLDAHGTGILGAVTTMVPELQRRARRPVRARRAQGLGARFPCR